MRGLLAGLVAVLLTVGPSVAAEAPKPIVYPEGWVPPDWLRKPTPDQLMAVVPEAAIKSGRGGKATISCTITVQGALSACEVVSEDPPGLGFGNAAVVLSSQLQFKPATLKGVPTVAQARIPIIFPPGHGPTSTSVAVLPSVMMRAAPSYQDVAAAYPAIARAKGAGGRAAMRCTITKAGGLKSCSIISEAPSSMGFGAAAKSLASKFLAPTSLPDGKSTSGDLAQITVTFAQEMLQPDLVPTAGKPNWVATPNTDQLSAAMPRTGEGGTIRVLLNCLIAPDGSATDCKIESETPADKGYGAAALSVSQFFKVSVWSLEGLPTVGARVRIPLRYEIAAAPKPVAKP